jgi:hypothetical protein
MVEQPTRTTAHREWHVVFILAASLWGLAGCLKWPVENSSTQPDEVLFERGMYAVEDNRFDVAHITFQTLINTYPDSEYARKAAVVLEDPRIARCGESWSFSPDCDGGFASAPPTN